MRDSYAQRIVCHRGCCAGTWCRIQGVKKAGSIGKMGCFSFYPGKNLGAYGEGGIVVTNDTVLDKSLRMLRDWGQEEKGFHVIHGFNTRMDGIQGAVLGVKMRYLEQWTLTRIKKAAKYKELLAGSGIVIPKTISNNRHVYHVYAVRVSERDIVREKLGSFGIQSGVHYAFPVHLQPCYSWMGHKPGDFPEAERAAAEELSLPIYPELTDDDIREVCEGLKKSL